MLLRSYCISTVAQEYSQSGSWNYSGAFGFTFNEDQSFSTTFKGKEFKFKADKILELIGKLSATSSNATLKTISTLAGQYDGMKVGMEMVK